MVIDCLPQQIGLAAQCHENFVEVPGRARLATRSFNAMRKPRAEFVGSAPDRFVADDHPAFKEQLFNVAQTQLKAKIPAYSATDDGSRKAVAVAKRFSILHHTILHPRSGNVTKPSALFRCPVSTAMEPILA